MKLTINVSNHALRRTLGAVAITGALGVAYFVGVARADGIPTGEVLFYSGTLEDNGVPVDGTRAVSIELFDAVSGGSAQCTTSAAAVTITAGHFRVPLSSTCVVAIRANPNLFLEVTVGGTVLPRSKLGAVPYAVEAARADNATTAEDADLLDGVDSAAFALTAHQHDTAALTSGTLPLNRGGTGISTLTGNSNRLLGANPAGTGWELKSIGGTANETVVTQSGGAITVGLAAGTPHACERIEASTATSQTTATCPGTKVVVGGGGACAPSDDQGTATENRMKYTRPASDRSGWLTVCTVTNGTKVTWSYAICCEE